MLCINIKYFFRKVCKSTRVNIDIRYFEVYHIVLNFIKKKNRFAIVAEVYHVSKYYADPLTFTLKIWNSYEGNTII